MSAIRASCAAGLAEIDAEIAGLTDNRAERPGDTLTRCEEKRQHLAEAMSAEREIPAPGFCASAVR